jgi:hypothetical protein
MTKWHVYGHDEERIATVTGNIHLGDGGTIAFSDHLGYTLMYAPHAYSSVARADWEDEN